MNRLTQPMGLSPMWSLASTAHGRGLIRAIETAAISEHLSPSFSELVPIFDALFSSSAP